MNEHIEVLRGLLNYPGLREYVGRIIYDKAVAALAAMGGQGEDDAWCAECGVKLELVRPGKHQHPTCSQAAPEPGEGGDEH